MATSLPRVAIITGAARGIGRAISLRLAQDGLNIVAADLPARSTELESLTKEINALAVRKDGRDMAMSVYADVTSEKDVNALIGAAVEKFGGVDVMVANAGICTGNGLVATSLDEWEKLFAVNVRGVFLCYKAAAAQMIKQERGGRIIGASSRAGKQADDLAKHNITVNAYAPGRIPTELLKGLYSDLATISTVKPPDAPMGEPEDIAGLVSYLVREESKFVKVKASPLMGDPFMIKYERW